MVRVTTTYQCGRCRETHFSYEEARQCESNHIMDDAAAKTRAKIAEAFKQARSA